MAQPTAALVRIIDQIMRPIYDRQRAVIAALLGLPTDHEKTRLCAHSVISQIVHYVQGKSVNAKIWPELELTPERIEQIGNHIADFSLAYLTSSPAKEQNTEDKKIVKTKITRRNK